MTRERFYLRLEPTRPAGDSQRGFAAELADPAWMVGRQWQMGEHQGEDASSPLAVHLRVRHVRIEPMLDRPHSDPREVPAEAILEAASDDWWTVGRRARLGLAAQDGGLIASLNLDAGEDAAARFEGLTGPYAVLNAVAYDGRKLHALKPADPVFREVPVRRNDHWRTDMLAYVGSFPCGDTELAVGGVDGGERGRWGGHDGGDVDWWSVDAEGTVDSDATPPKAFDRWPDRFRWPGAPASRWWQIEDHQVDLGGLPPDRAHLATTMLLDLVLGHADDWFLVPIPARPGHVLHLEPITITDSFGETWPKPDGDQWPEAIDWAMFQVAGLAANQLPIWPTAAAPLVGEPIDEVTIGIDEDTNLVWAVEERLLGQVTDRQRPDPEPIRIREEDEPPVPALLYRYTPATAVPRFWHPYTREVSDGVIRFVQGRLVSVDLHGNSTPTDLPSSPFLDRSGPGLHQLAPWRLPPTGVRLESRPILARATTGEPVLWIQRRRQPLLSTPTSGLRLDALIATGDEP